MIYFKVLKYPFFIFEVNLKYFVGGSKRYLASNFNIDFLSLKKCRLSQKRILGDGIDCNAGRCIPTLKTILATGKKASSMCKLASSHHKTLIFVFYTIFTSLKNIFYSASGIQNKHQYYQVVHGSLQGVIWLPGIIGG